MIVGDNNLSGCTPASLWHVDDNDLEYLALPPCGIERTPQSLEDRAALVALYETTDGPNWKNNANWLNDAPLREWFGVTTNLFGRVTELRLGGKRIEWADSIVHD